MGEGLKRVAKQFGGITTISKDGKVNHLKVKPTLAERRKEREAFYSKCCKAKFESKSNGLWTYYVCNQCGKKTEVTNGKGKMLDLYGVIKREKNG